LAQVEQVLGAPVASQVLSDLRFGFAAAAVRVSSSPATAPGGTR